MPSCLLLEVEGGGVVDEEGVDRARLAKLEEPRSWLWLLDLFVFLLRSTPRREREEAEGECWRRGSRWEAAALSR